MMISLSSYKSIINPNSSSIGQIHQSQSEMVLENTWDRDLQSRPCYIYDYRHDSEPNKNVNLNPSTDELKTLVNAKYIVTKYDSLSQDQVEYHLMFKPSHTCPLDYFNSDYGSKYGAEYPIGLYVDIPDNKGVYRKWLICSKDLDVEFITYTILPCNYYFHWIDRGEKCKMWGIARLRNSYNSGLWTEYKTTTVENQDQIWIPNNNISDTLDYLEDSENKRIIISARRPQPLIWKISKIENVHPFGLTKVTVVQTKFDHKNDYVVPLSEADSVYEMYADYWKNEIEPSDVNVNPDSPINDYCKIKYTGSPPLLKLGGGYKSFSINFYDTDGNNINDNFSMNNNNWSFIVSFTNNEGEVIEEDISKNVNVSSFYSTSSDYFTVKIKLYDNNNAPNNNINLNSYLGKIITISVSDDENTLSASCQAEIVSL